MLRPFFPGILFLTLWSQCASAQPLEALYFERPPYYATVNGQPDGLLIRLARDILTQAGVQPIFQEMPPQRILEVIKANQRPVCSIGWFRTPERDAYAAFSLPIYQDEPLRAVFLKSGAMPPPDISSFAQLAGQTNLSIGLNQSYAYGRPVDALITRMRAPAVKTTGTQVQLMRMLGAKRFDFMLASPEEIETLAELAGIPVDDLYVLTLTDLPKGNLRYLMFSRNTAPELIARVNSAIEQLARPAGRAARRESHRPSRARTSDRVHADHERTTRQPGWHDAGPL